MLVFGSEQQISQVTDVDNRVDERERRTDLPVVWAVEQPDTESGHDQESGEPAQRKHIEEAKRIIDAAADKKLCKNNCDTTGDH